MSRRPTERAAQNQQTIKSLLKLEGNKQCADCKRNKHPRWASWNLGVFVCIRCSGIHRGMGTHISRVKSVDLDAWTDEQLQSILRWGNARANKYWESKLAHGHVPSEAKIENFIRTKYESKRWVMDGPMPDPSTLSVDGDDDVPLNIVQEKVKLDRSSSQRNASAPSPAIPPPKKAAAPAFDLIGGDDVPAPPARPSTTDAPGAAVRPPPAKPPPTSSQLLGGLGGDFFGGGGGGQPERPSSASSKPAGLSRPDLKQSILSLYASSPKPQSQPAPSNPAAHERQSSVGGQQPGASSSAFGGLNDAFSGLNFGSTSSAPSAAPTATQTPQISQAAKPSPFASFGQPPAAAKSIPAPPQISSPLGGGGFFDTGPKPPPKPSGGAPAKASTVPPPLSVRKISNASDGFGDFSAAVPHTASSAATSSNGLLDLSAGLPSQPSTAGGARTSNPVATHSSIFNLGGGKNPSGGGGGGGMPALKAPPNYNALAQSSAPPTKSSFATPLGAADPWGANEWATPDPAPAVSNAGPKSPAGGSGTDFGWGAAPAAASSKPSAPPATTSMQADWGAPSPAAAAPAKQSGWATSPVASSAVVGDAAGWGFGDAGASASAAPKPAPRVTAEEDFGDWGSAAQPAVPPAGSGAGAGAGAKMPAGEDLFSNVWE